jgi:hypothetical protein|tara:strand:+ start:2086 stop:2535 length:450 start_codon:yes stop_codon:yes gene_type:complete
MAHFAKISENNLVLQVLVLDDKDCINSEKVEIESIGQKYLETHNNWPAHLWIQTSFNTFNGTHVNGGTPFRGNYAGIGFEWDETNQIFWPPKPFSSWVKDISTADWKSPIGDMPELTEEQKTQRKAGTHDWYYNWNETNTTWDLTNELE